MRFSTHVIAVTSAFLFTPSTSMRAARDADGTNSSIVFHHLLETRMDCYINSDKSTHKYSICLETNSPVSNVSITIIGDVEDSCLNNTSNRSLQVKSSKYFFSDITYVNIKIITSYVVIRQNDVCSSIRRGII